MTPTARPSLFYNLNRGQRNVKIQEKPKGAVKDQETGPGPARLEEPFLVAGVT
jgi:hypothetical protein